MTEMSKIEDVQTVAPMSSAVAATRSRGRRAVKRMGLAVVLLAGAAGGGWFGYDYWTYGRFLVSTDDAYVKADYTSVAPKVSGYIANVLVEDNQPVKAPSSGRLAGRWIARWLAIIGGLRKGPSSRSG